MKIAVISDIHGNFFALQEVIKDIEKKDIDTIICLGDLVGYGPFPNKVIELIRNRKILCIKGNYDASVVDEAFSYIRDTETNKISLPWAVKNTNKENKSYLDNLPQKIEMKVNDKKLVFVHGSTRKINEYLKENSYQADEVMKSFCGDVLVCAHTHIPYVKKYKNKVLFNEGSVGKPKYGKPLSTYGMLEIADKISFKIIEVPYDYRRTMEAMKKMNFPSSLIQNIETGME